VTADRVIESRTGELLIVMGELKQLHEELLTVLQQKLAAMRRADTEGLNSCTARQRFLVDRIRQKEGLRRQVVQLIGKAMGMPAERAADWPLRELAERLPEPRRGQLLAQAAVVREILLAIDKTNTVAALVTGEMLKHFQQVCAAMARTGQSTGTYSSAGRLNSEPPVGVFEAVG